MTEFDAYAMAFWVAWVIATMATLGMTARVGMDWADWHDGRRQPDRLIIRTIESLSIWAGLIGLAAIQGAS